MIDVNDLNTDNSITISLLEIVGPFAENKDLGRDIRVKKIESNLAKDKKVILDFAGIDGATQSFIHSMISQVIRDHGSVVLESLFFKECSEPVQAIIAIVVDYMQQID
ncbi:MAG: hypothetical protein JWP06_982 [Candidatus Saccharibacteria bacterium]|nr:hypothetical protein [Candidatus Saccharibacteria bacterium]